MVGRPNVDEIHSPRWSQPPYLSSPRSSPPEAGLNPANASNHNEFAASVAAEGLKLISDGATGVCVWEMNDISWKKNSYGLIDLNGNARPAVADFTTFLQQIGRSSDVIAYGANAGPGLAAAAFHVTKNGRRGLVEVRPTRRFAQGFRKFGRRPRTGSIQRTST